jgi:hypothetical protein
MINSKFVICIDNSDYPVALERRKIYAALPDSDAAKTGLIRVVDESGEGYLYPASCFIDANLSKETQAALISAA